MNIQSLHNNDKAVSAKALFSGSEAKLMALQILKGKQLKEHTTPVPALLVCVSGEVIFGNEKGISENLKPGDYIHIEPDVKHWVDAVVDSQLLLFK